MKLLKYEGYNLTFEPEILTLNVFKRLFMRDKTKDKLAMENGFTVIRIDVDYPNYDRFDFIKTSIMSSPFPSIYNIYNINFKEAHKFACYTNEIHI